MDVKLERELRELLDKNSIRELIYAYANNHYAGHAPATIKQFQELWQAKGLPEIGKPQRRAPKESLLLE